MQLLKWITRSGSGIATTVGIIAICLYAVPADASENINRANNNTEESDFARKPAQTTYQFYSWYLSNLAADYTFSGHPDFRSKLSAWLTRRFIGKLDDIIQRTDADPFLLVQDPDPSWSHVIVVSPVAEHSANAIEQVVLGDSTSQREVLKVRLVLIKGNWRIDAVNSSAK